MYLMLMMHGSTLTQLGEFMTIFFASPLAMGAILATFHIRAGVRERQAFELLEKIGIPKTQNVIFGIVLPRIVFSLDSFVLHNVAST